MERRTCERCGSPLGEPSASYTPSGWAKIRFCSLSCAARDFGDAKRVRGSEAKPCLACGEQMRWPDNYSRKQWDAKRYCNQACNGAARRTRTDEAKPLLACTICGERVRQRWPNQKTCRKPECVAQHRVQFAGPKGSARMKTDYASGKRKRGTGVSPREVALWPLLRDHGWLWRLRWTEAPDRTMEIDFAKPAEMLAVEIDGPEHNWVRKGRAWDTDAERDAALSSRGWRILRISNAEVDADPQAVAARVLAWGDSPTQCQP